MSRLAFSYLVFVLTLPSSTSIYFQMSTGCNSHHVPPIYPESKQKHANEYHNLQSYKKQKASYFGKTFFKMSSMSAVSHILQYNIRTTYSIRKMFTLFDWLINRLWCVTLTSWKNYSNKSYWMDDNTTLSVAIIVCIHVHSFRVWYT